MSVRKRGWTTAKGEAKESWVADYVDGQGKRRLKTFDKKRDAERFAATAAVEVDAGVHIADSASITVTEAGKLWIITAEKAGRERSTVDQYRQHLDRHITPFIGRKKLTALTVPMVRQFEDDLLDSGRSPALTRKLLVSVGSLLSDAMERGLVGRNVVRDMRRRRGTTEGRAEKRAKGKLKVGVDIPLPAEIRSVVVNLSGRWRPILLVSAFAGLRASELRGLDWEQVNLLGGRITVNRRADRFRKIGRPKSEAGDREVPIPPLVVSALREWKVQCGSPERGLVFPAGDGGPLAHRTVDDAWIAAQLRAGVTVVRGTEQQDKSVVGAKYTGLHALRHFYASWCINRKVDGGLELPPKLVQTRLGHSSIVLTMDVYGHLFPSGDDGAELAAATAFLIGA